MKHDSAQVAKTLTRAIESRDQAKLLTLYARDAVIEVVNKQAMPSRPKELLGYEAIAAYYQEVCGRAMDHRIRQLVVDEDGLAFSEDCTYPDGTHVLNHALLQLKGGQIVRQIQVEAWDE